MGKSRRKSRKHKGGNPQPTPVDCEKVACPQTTADNSLAAITKTGLEKNRTDAETMTKASKSLASGGGKRKKGGAAKVICPQPAAGSGGSIGAGGSSAGKNMCNGVKHTMQTQSNATYDDAAKDLSTAPPCNPFSGKCGGGKRRRRRKTRRRCRKYKKKSKRKSKRKTRRKTKKRRGRKSRRRRY